VSLPCPKCGTSETLVSDTRMRIDGEGMPYVRRRRKCQKCGDRFASVENRESDLEAEDVSAAG
jgi:transcriptional regulator NrdR family protein